METSVLSNGILPRSKLLPQHLHIPSIEAHAALGTLAWGFFLPLGAIIFTLRRYPRSSILRPRFNTFWFHTVMQSLGITMALANFGIGIHIALKYKKKVFNNPHTIVGTVVIALMTLQPILGGVHHLLYKKKLSEEELESSEDESQRKQTIASEDGSHRNLVHFPTEKTSDRTHSPPKWFWFGMVHRWIGRVIIILGMIAGGLGFMLAKEYRPVFSYTGMAVYSVFVPVVWVIWMGFILGGFLARKREAKRSRNSMASATGMR